MPRRGTKKQKTKKPKRRQRFAWLYKISGFLSPTAANNSPRLNDRYCDGMCTISVYYYSDSLTCLGFYSTDYNVSCHALAFTVNAKNDGGRR